MGGRRALAHRAWFAGWIPFIPCWAVLGNKKGRPLWGPPSLNRLMLRWYQRFHLSARDPSVKPAPIAVCGHAAPRSPRALPAGMFTLSLFEVRVVMAKPRGFEFLPHEGNPRAAILQANWVNFL